MPPRAADDRLDTVEGDVRALQQAVGTLGREVAEMQGAGRSLAELPERVAELRVAVEGLRARVFTAGAFLAIAASVITAVIVRLMPGGAP